MAPDRRALFEAAYGALMIRNARPQPPRQPGDAAVEQNPKSNSQASFASGSEPTRRAG